MKVKELRAKLSQFKDDTQVVVHWENEDKQDYFEIDNISLMTGTPNRDEKTHKAGFHFDAKGPATWLFIEISPAESTFSCPNLSLPPAFTNYQRLPAEWLQSPITKQVLANSGKRG